MELYNLEFSQEEIAAAVAAHRLLSMEIEFSRLCNFRCAYCYVEEKDAGADELTVKQIKHTLTQARELGARKIIILGGEPSIYPHLVEMIVFIRSLGCEIEIFTNGTGVTPELAHSFACNKVRVVLKMNSQDSRLQNRLAGDVQAASIREQALYRLRQAGYPGSGRFLAISTIICQQNIDELPTMWRWAREQGIEPYFEVLTPQANAQKNTWLSVQASQLYSLFQALAEIDREEFGRHWRPQPPLVGNRCMRHQVSCVVTANGTVMPCVGVTIALGSVKEQPLAEILQHPVVQNLKNYRTTIKGPCRLCDQSENCYGCRGAAFQLTGDYLASDPTCWKHDLCEVPTVSGEHLPHSKK